MIEHISIFEHNFDKINFFTLEDNKSTYDLYKCKDCGLTGKRRGTSEYIEIDTNKCKPEDFNLSNLKIYNPKRKVIAVIQYDNGNNYEEEFEIPSSENPEEYINEEINLFNKQYNKHRKLIKIKQ